nr:helix-turn-helix domain-containing protein [uncultured Roseateles sp.]
MKISVESAEELALVLRAVRKSSRVRLDDLAKTVGVSKQTATNVEQGKAKLSTMLAFLHELGVVVSVEVPQSSLPVLHRLQSEAAARGVTTQPAAE